MIKNDAILNEEVDPKLVRTEPGCSYSVFSNGYN